ncbi:MAG: FGGY-family carbohydrate kinase [Lachnospiraceae bacterium]
MGKYVIGIDQSTQGTKAVLFDESGRLLERCDAAHEQKIDGQGWISHDPQILYANVLRVAKQVIEKAKIDKNQVACLGLTNQRETTGVWDKRSGEPLADAIVWQCSRAKEICSKMAEEHQQTQQIYAATGLTLSPFYPASKMRWFMEHVPEVERAVTEGHVAFGTVDSWLLFKLSGHTVFKTDATNARRTQLFNIHTLCWDEAVCGAFQIPMQALPEVVDSDDYFAETDLDGYLEHAIPIRAVMGDSHAALFAHNCRQPGQLKATYGTGSSVMLNVGEQAVVSQHGLSSSIAWKIQGTPMYVLEGNINYTGAVITWLKELGVLLDPAAATQMAQQANPEDQTCIVPAFSGLGAPWWKHDAHGIIVGLGRSTGKNEMVRAACDSIAFQIYDVIDAMRKDTGLPIHEIKVDGGPTRNSYLMQLQSDLIEGRLMIPKKEELSVIGAAYLAGIAAGIYDEQEVFARTVYDTRSPALGENERIQQLEKWKRAISVLLK